MTDSQPADGADLADSPHYLRALTDMADERAVVADAAIYSDNGIKLVEKGTRIDSRLYDRLVQHKLREPLDRHLSVEQAVGTEELLATAQGLTEQAVLPGLLVDALGSGARLLAPLRAVPLPGPIACKLTVLRTRWPNLFEHTVQMTLVALFLGLRSGLDDRDCTALAAAALLHDLGVLHMDPALIDPRHKLSGAQRKHLVAHPITAMLMARDAQAYSKAVEVAVLEHHERMDGSGYPRGLVGADISALGRILLLSEVVTAFFEKYDDIPAQRLSLTLRLNHRKFPVALVAHILPLLQEEVARESALMPLGDDAPRQIDLLAQAFTQWHGLKAALPALGPEALRPDSPFGYANTRLLALEKTLIEAGSHPRQQDELLPQLQGDVIGLAEVAMVGREALWQLQSILNGCLRRFPQLAKRATPHEAAVADWCDWAVQRL